MIPDSLIENLVSWSVQVFLVASTGVLLPLLFRIRHPRSQLAYYHAVLGVCLALPLIQPWQSSLVFITSQVAAARQPAAPGISWGLLVAGIVVGGIAVRLSWLAVGLWQLRCLRKTAVPICIVPESIREARILTGSDARFLVSRDVTTPATLGSVDPVILVPQSFLSLNSPAQRSIACHELLHVRRKDWLVTLAEELAGALLWFNPAVRWLLAQAKLSREQVVDAEVVRLTAAKPYIEALLSMAVVVPDHRVLPAAPFFTEGHLAHRLRLLLAGPNRSFGRLCFSYFWAAGLLALTFWCAGILFPLQGEAQIVAPTFHSWPPSVVLHVQEPKPPTFKPRGEFTVAVPPPASPTANVKVFFSIGEPETDPYTGELLGAPPPPPPFPRLAMAPHFAFLTAKGIRVLRPGEVASPEEVDRFVSGFPERSLVDVTRADDGTIEKIQVLVRRIPDEPSFVPLGSPLILHGPVPAGAADTVHRND